MALAIKLIPKEVMDEARVRAGEAASPNAAEK
jgi:hypothetical protein